MKGLRLRLDCSRCCQWMVSSLFTTVRDCRQNKRSPVPLLGQPDKPPHAISVYLYLSVVNYKMVVCPSQTSSPKRFPPSMRMISWNAQRTQLEGIVISHDLGQRPCEEQFHPLPHTKDDSLLSSSSSSSSGWPQRLLFLVSPTMWHPRPVDNSRVPLLSPLLFQFKLPPKQAHIHSSIPSPCAVMPIPVRSIESIHLSQPASRRRGPGSGGEACHHKTFFQMHSEFTSSILRFQIALLRNPHGMSCSWLVVSPLCHVFSSSHGRLPVTDESHPQMHGSSARAHGPSREVPVSQHAFV